MTWINSKSTTQPTTTTSPVYRAQYYVAGRIESPGGHSSPDEPASANNHPNFAQPSYLRIATITLLTVYLVSCQSPKPNHTAMITAELPCTDPGTIRDGKIEESIRGYAYYFQLYLPPCYDLEPDRHYPTIYLLPGQGGSARGWVDAGLAQIADDMILNGRIPPFLIVITGNNDVDLLGEVVHQDLLPYIEANYRVLAERPYRTVSGGSLGGSRAYRLALNNPDTFASAGVFGNGLVPGDEPQLQQWLDTIPNDQRPRFFFNTGEQDPYMLDLAEEMVALLDRNGYETTATYTPGGHNYEYWLSNMSAYWLWASEDWQ